MVTNAFPVNEAKPLIEIPTNIPQIGFLGGEQGKEIDASVKRDYKDFPVMQVGNYSNGIVKGSNPFYVVGVQSKLPAGIRVSTQGDLETAMRIANGLNLRGTYEDTGLVLRTEGNPNSYLAQNLMKQVKDRNGKRTRMPVMIPLYGIELVKDQNSPQGLAFKLKDDAEIVYAPILREGGNFSSEDVNIQTGLPKRLGKGDRTLYTISEGLSGWCLGRDLGLGSSGSDLADSSDYGRVVVVGAEGTASNFDKYLIELKKIKDTEDAELQGRFKKAEAVLKGK